MASKNLISKIAFASDLLERANDAMVEAIQQAVDENGGTLKYEVTTNQFSGEMEVRNISCNDDGDFCIFDDSGNELYMLQDVTSDELCDICGKIN